MTRIPDLLTVQQSNGRYIVRRGQSGAGTDDADLVTIDTSVIANIDGDTLKEALASIDARLVALASSLTAGDYPIVGNFKPRSVRLPATNPARRVEVIDNPNTHLHEKIIFDADNVDHNAIWGADLPIGFTPGDFAVDVHFYAEQSGLASSDTMNLYLAFLSYGDGENINPSYGADALMTLNWPGAANVRNTVTALITSPGFSEADTLGFRLRSLGADANDFSAHVTGIMVRRL